MELVAIENELRKPHPYDNGNMVSYRSAVSDLRFVVAVSKAALSITASAGAKADGLLKAAADELRG